MAQSPERHEVASRPASEVEEFERRIRFDVIEQRRDVLADVVVARAFPERPRFCVVVRERARGYTFKLVPSQRHGDMISSVPRSGMQGARQARRVPRLSARMEAT
jgi:hypothetical protein